MVTSGVVGQYVDNNTHMQYALHRPGDHSRQKRFGDISPAGLTEPIFRPVIAPMLPADKRQKS